MRTFDGIWEEHVYLVLFRLFSLSIRRLQVASRRMYELVDIGANLGHPSYKKDLDDVIERSKQAGENHDNWKK